MSDESYRLAPQKISHGAIIEDSPLEPIWGTVKTRADFERMQRETREYVLNELRNHYVPK